jgi:hypothetical protein
MDPELSAARLILELLASSRLTRHDVLLKQATELAREPLSTIPPRDTIRSDVFSAIETLQNAIQDGADVEFIEQWHEYAMSLANGFIASRS